MVGQVMCLSCLMWELADPIASCSDHICSKCWLLEELRLRVDELESELHTLRHFREGETYLDTVFQEAVTPVRVSSLNPASGQGQQGVTASQAGKGNQQSGTHEPQPLTLSNRHEALAPCVDGEQGCRNDESADQGTMVQQAIQGEGVNRQIVVVGDSIIRGIDSILCEQDKESRVVCCLPGARVRDISNRLERILEREREDPVVVVHVGTNNIGKSRKEDLFRDYKELGFKLKNRSSRVIISGLLPEPRANWHREARIREVNTWLKEWCGKVGFLFMGHWHQFWERGDLYRWDGLHLNRAGTSVLAKRVNRVVNRTLN
ncbi:uncharacterized protein [Scyliorhinus torazame]|uniref:uncharacterized protein n=1 Tax=Scyliorhinus torazame TaxID=75743 RepID=UPI003B5CCFA7